MSSFSSKSCLPSVIYNQRRNTVIELYSINVSGLNRISFRYGGLYLIGVPVPLPLSAIIILAITNINNDLDILSISGSFVEVGRALKKHREYG
jgi:hypothetical protein